MITPEQVTQFKEKGYVELRKFFTPQEVDSALAAIRVAKQCDVGRDRLNDKGLVFNHNLYFHNPSIQQFVSQKKIIDTLVPLAGPNIWIRWDQMVTKQPGGIEFPWHQDNGYNGVKDQHFQFWVALSASNPINGGLWLIPGSHKRGVRPHKWVGTHKVWESNPEEENKEIAITANAGDAVIFSSLLLHRTKPNTSQTTRIAYVIEYMSMKHYDPFLKPPYFMVARNGVSTPSFENTYPGMKNPLNHLKYPKLLVERLRH